MDFRISGLQPRLFTHLFAMTASELAAHRALRSTVDHSPGVPCRVSLDDIAPGQDVILVNFEHLPVASPYRSSHAIYVGADSRTPFDRIGEIPPAIARRLISARAFSAAGLMVSADVVEGKELAAVIERMFEDASVEFIHAHYAKAGCFAARIDRV
jgi:hypothetical protein